MVLLGGGPVTAGVLTAAIAAGAFLSSLFSGRVGGYRWHGRGIARAIEVFGAAISAFALALVLAAVGIGAPNRVDADHANIPMIVAACVALAIGGAADNVSAIYRSPMLQAAVPDAVRGRLQGIFIVVVAGGPRIGALRRDARHDHHSVVPAAGGRHLIIAIVAVLARLHPRFPTTPRTLSLASRGPRRTPARLRRVSDVALGGCRRRRTPPLESARDTFPRLPASSGAGRSRAFCSGDRRAVRSRGDHLGIELPLHESRPRRHLPRAGRVGTSRAGRRHARRLRPGPSRPASRRAVRKAGVGHMTVLAVTFCVVPFLLFSWAEQHVSSGLGSIYNATTPIMTAIMAALVFRVERLKPVQIAGIVVGIGGVVVIIAPWTGLDLTQSVVAQLALLGATACYGFSLAYMRRFLANSGMTRSPSPS
jgi:MFS family permease